MTKIKGQFFLHKLPNINYNKTMYITNQVHEY